MSGIRLQHTQTTSDFMENSPKLWTEICIYLSIQTEKRRKKSSRVKKYKKAELAHNLR